MKYILACKAELIVLYLGLALMMGVAMYACRRYEQANKAANYWQNYVVTNLVVKGHQ